MDRSEAETLDGRGAAAPFFELGIAVVSKTFVFETVRHLIRGVW
jgi:hypothetical protein